MLLNLSGHSPASVGLDLDRPSHTTSLAISNDLR
jgi:hypothetical protein